MKKKSRTVSFVMLTGYTFYLLGRAYSVCLMVRSGLVAKVRPCALGLRAR